MGVRQLVWALLALAQCVAAGPSAVREPPDVNAVIHQQLMEYQQVLGGTTTKAAAAEEAKRHFAHLQRMERKHALSDPAVRMCINELDVLEDDGYTPESAALFSELASALSGATTPLQALTSLLARVEHLDPMRWQGIRTAYPIMRRAVTSYIVETHMAGHRFSPEEQQLVQKIAFRFLKLHRLAAQSKSMIEFMHVSKSGGTSICQLAEANGCSSEGFDTKKNCLIGTFPDLPRWTVPGSIPSLAPFGSDPWPERFGRSWYGRTWTCTKRRQFMTKLRYNFYANEYVMHPDVLLGAPPSPGHSNSGDGSAGSSTPGVNDDGVDNNGSSSAEQYVDGIKGGFAAQEGATANASEYRYDADWMCVRACREFLNVLMLRNPSERLLSHLRHLLQVYSGVYNGTAPLPHFMDHFQPANVSQWKAFALPVVDNYLARSLLGPTVYNAPIGTFDVPPGPGLSAPQAHLEVAKAVLVQFEVLLTLESHALNDVVFKLGLGWARDLTQHHARKGKPSPAAFESTPDIQALLAQGTSLDLELYSFGLAMHALDAVTYGIVHAGMARQAQARAHALTLTQARAASQGVPLVLHASLSNATEEERGGISMHGWGKGALRRCGYVGLRSGGKGGSKLSASGGTLGSQSGAAATALGGSSTRWSKRLIKHVHGSGGSGKN